MSWMPTAKQAEYLKCVLSMTTDALMGKGVDTSATYVANLLMVCDHLKEEEPSAEALLGCCRCGHRDEDHTFFSSNLDTPEKRIGHQPICPRCHSDNVSTS